MSGTQTVFQQPARRESAAWRRARALFVTNPTSIPPLETALHDITPWVSPTPADTLHAVLRALIASSRQRLAGALNAELTRLDWSVWQRLRTEVLGGADSAKYGAQLIKRMGDKLAQEYGRGFEAQNLRLMMQFALAFPDAEKVASLMRHLSWCHFFNLLPLKTEQARQFYANQAASQTWYLCELHQ